MSKKMCKPILGMLLTVLVIIIAAVLIDNSGGEFDGEWRRVGGTQTIHLRRNHFTISNGFRLRSGSGTFYISSTHRGYQITLTYLGSRRMVQTLDFRSTDDTITIGHTTFVRR